MINLFTKIASLSVIMGLSFCAPFLGSSDVQLNKIQLPKGFQIEIFASDVPGARSLTQGSNGTIFVGTRGEGKVYALRDMDQDHQIDRTIVIDSGLYMPNGVAFRNGDLYVAEIHRILRYNNIEEQLSAPPEPEVLNDNYPSDKHHGWKYIRFGPDGKLYVPVGAPCNICKSEKEIYASLTRLNPDGTGREIYAHGIRNTVGFDWHPKTEVLWFTDNGRDWMGDNKPPDELNRAPEKGLHFGYPYCHGKDLPDPKYGEQRSCSEFTPPAQELGPHVAALDAHFYTGNMFPDKYRNNLLIAEHGSWNRSTPIGYRLMWVRIEKGKAQSYKVFANGWLQGTDAWGRPVALHQLPDGSLLVSDDHAGVIYRISYTGG